MLASEGQALPVCTTPGQWSAGAEQIPGKTVCSFMNRVAAHLLLLAGATCAAPSFAKDKPDKPRPRLELQPIIAANLLAPAEPLTIPRTPRLSVIDVERSGLIEPPP